MIAEMVDRMESLMEKLDYLAGEHERVRKDLQVSVRPSLLFELTSIEAEMFRTEQDLRDLDLELADLQLYEWGI